MAKTPSRQLADHGQSVWIDYLSRPFVQDGDLAGLVERGRRGRHVQPDHLPGRDRRGRRLRRPDPRARSRRARPSPRRSSSRWPSTTSAAPATSCAPSTTSGERQGRLRLARGRPEPRARHRGDDRGGQAPARAGRPPEPVHQDPRHPGGPAGDRGDHRGRHPRQRDADLLARALPRGRRGLRPRPRAARRERRRPRPRSPPSPRSSSPAWTPRATSASTRSAATTS